MNEGERNFFEGLCKICLLKYQVLNSTDMISTLISQASRMKGIDVPFIRGILYVEINNRKRPYAHCFNMYKGQVIDGSIYSYAMLNKNIENAFPLYVVGNEPYGIEYSVNGEVRLDKQFKFKEGFLKDLVEAAPDYANISIKRFSNIEDGRKKNLFYYDKL